MARKHRIDRGLFQRPDASGKLWWWVRLWHCGCEKKFGRFKNKSMARAFYERAKVEQAENRFFPEKYHRNHSPLCETIIADRVATSLIKNKSAERGYAHWWTARLKGVRLNGLMPTMLDEAKRDLLVEGLAPQTVRHYLQFLRHILNEQVLDGQLDKNPFNRVRLPKPGKGKTRFLSVSEERRLMEELGPVYAKWARFAIVSGLRLGEQLKMKWEDIDFEQAHVLLPVTKSQEAQYAKLNTEALAILRSLPRRQDSMWVFPSRTGTALDQRNFTSRIFSPAAHRAGLRAVTWHTLRHTCASRLSMSKYNERTISAVLRHSSTSLAKRYSHLHPDFLSQALEDVSQFGAPMETGQTSWIGVEGGTVPQTGPEEESPAGGTLQVVDILERAMGFEPTTTSLGS